MLRRNYSLANRIVVVGIKKAHDCIVVVGFRFYTFLDPNVYMRCEFNGSWKLHH